MKGKKEKGPERSYLFKGAAAARSPNPPSSEDVVENITRLSDNYAKACLFLIILTGAYDCTTLRIVLMSTYVYACPVLLHALNSFQVYQENIYLNFLNQKHKPEVQY
jgi:hypothetical protein